MYRNQAQSRYTELNQQVQDFNFDTDNFKNNPESKYDSLITKQNCVNDALSNQVQEARDKLSKLSHSLKNIEICGKGKEVSGPLCIHRLMICGVFVCFFLLKNSLEIDW